MYLPILTYHRLLKQVPTRSRDPQRIAVSQAQFRSHLALLSRLGYRTASLADYPEQLRHHTPPRGKHFAITFDDGYEEVLTLALPVLQEFGYTATIFAVPGELGGHNAWDDGRARLLSATQLRMLQTAGMTIGAHTCHHVHLPQVSSARATKEIVDSKRLLEDILGRTVSLFAYPYGESNLAVESMLRHAGFKAGFATDRAPRNHILNVFRLRRVVIFPRTNAWELLWKVRSWYPLYQDVKGRRSQER